MLSIYLLLTGIDKRNPSARKVTEWGRLRRGSADRDHEPDSCDTEGCLSWRLVGQPQRCRLLDGPAKCYAQVIIYYLYSTQSVSSSVIQTTVKH